MDMLNTSPATYCPPAPSLSEMFGKRLDMYLPTLQRDDERRQFLTAQRQKFEQNYGHFQRAKRVKLHPSYGLVSDFDFVLTICEIDARLRSFTAEPVKTNELEEGDACPAPGCDGTIVIQRDGDCSSHISPPCGACVDARLACDVCGEDERS
jgi:hypothetical protein